jgi:hypothetical protein
MASEYEEIALTLFDKEAQASENVNTQPAPQQESSTEYESIATDLFGNPEQNFKQSAFAASRKDSGRMAEAVKLSKDFNLPPEFVERNLDSLREKRSQQTDLDYERIAMESPELSDWLSNPVNATVGKNDVNNLQKVTKNKNRIKPYNDEEWLDAGGAFESGMNNLASSSVHVAHAYGMIDADTAAEIVAARNKAAQDAREQAPSFAKEYSRVLEKEGGDIDKAVNQFLGGAEEYRKGEIFNALKEFTVGGAKTVGETLDFIGAATVMRPRGFIRSSIEQVANMAPSLVTGFAGAKVGATGGAAIGSAAPGIGTAAGATVGGIGGFVAGSFAGGVGVEVGAWFNQELSERGIDITNAQEIKQAYSNKKLMAQILKEAERKGVTTAGVDAAFNLFAGKFLKGAKGAKLSGKAKAVAKEATVQTVGESASEFAGQVAARDGDLGKVSYGDVVAEGILSLGTSAGDVVIGGAVRSVREQYSQDTVDAAEEISVDRNRAMQAIEESHAIKEMADAAIDSKTRELSPEVFSDLVGDEQQVYFQNNEWDEYWKSKGESPVKMAEELLGIDSYNDAVETGRDIEIAASEILSKLEDKEQFDDLMGILRTQPDGMTYTEASEFLQSMPETMKELSEEAVEKQDFIDQAEKSAREIQKQVEQQLVAAGRSKVEAAPIAEFYRVLGIRNSQDPQELFKKYGLNIQKVDGDVTASGDVLYQKETDPLGFYSKLNSTVVEMDFKSIPSKDLASRLKKTDGLKKEELEWTGVIDWLEAESRKVSKEEVAEFLNGGGVQIEEVTLSEASESDERGEYDIREVEDDDGGIVYAVEDWAGNDIEVFDNETEAEDYIESLVSEAMPTKFEDYSLPGGENYREVLLTLPPVEVDPGTLSRLEVDYEDMQAQAQRAAKEKADIILEFSTLFAKENADMSDEARRMMFKEVRNKIEFAGEGRNRPEVDENQQRSVDEFMESDQFSDELKQLFMEAVIATKKETGLSFQEYTMSSELRDARKNKSAKNYTSSHWDQENVLAHMRLSDRVDSNGKKTLLIDEIQSDWHQEGRKKGYKQASIDADVIEFLRNETDGLLDKLIDKYSLEGPDYRSKIQDIANQQRDGVPNAPFKQSDAWAMLVFKRALRMAAEQGYDAVAWTPGDVQAERYDLSKKISKVSYDSQTKTLVAVDLNGTPVMTESVEENKIDDYVGKDVAEKLVNSEPNESGIKSIEGDGLKVGGEGMKAFYDKMLPKAVGKYIKKLDKSAKVGVDSVDAGEREISARDEKYDELRKDIKGFSIDDFKVDESISDEDRTVYKVPASNRYYTVQHYNNDSVVYTNEDADIYGERFKSVDKFKEVMFGDMTDRSATQQVWHLPITEKLKAEVLSGQTLFQDDKKGFITKGPTDFFNNITLLRKADKSTFLHESGHYFLEILKDMSALDNTSQEIKDDFQGILEWLGVESADQIEVEHHEKWARGFEAYLREGKAPSDKLRKAFNTFKVWLTQVYKNLRQLNVELSPDVKDIMNRMLATQGEIDAARKEMRDEPLFTDPIAAGMSEAQAQKYRDAQGMAMIAAQEKLQKKLMRDRERKLKLKKKPIRDEITKQVNEERVFDAISILKKGVHADGAELGDGISAIKLDKSEFEKRFPQFKGNRNFYGMFSSENTVPMDMAASMLNYASTQDMAVEIANAPKKQDYINSLTEQRLSEIADDLLNKDVIAVEAMMDYHNEDRMKKIRMEYEHIASNNKGVSREITRRVSKRPTPQKQIKDLAIKSINNMPVGKLKPNTYRLAERRFAKLAGQELARGDVQAAFEAKEKELFNYELYRAAVEAKQTVDKKVKDTKKFFKKDEDLAKTRELDFINAARAVLSRYGIGRAKNDPMAYLGKMKEYNPDAYETVSSIIVGVMDDPDNYKNIEYSKFKDVMESIQALWDLSRDVKTVDVDGVKYEISKAVEEMSADMQKFIKPKAKEKYNRTATDLEKMKVGLLSVKALVQRYESWIDIMDLGDVRGSFRKFLFTNISEAVDKFEVQNTQYKKRILELSAPIKENMDLTKPIQADEIGFEFKNKAELLGALIHTGNESNLKKLLVGYGWGELDENGDLIRSNWDKFISRMQSEGVLTKEDYDYVQSLWDLMEEIKPQAQKAHKKVFGFYFDEITHKEFETPFGTYRGGYAPAKVDPFAVTDIARRSELEEFTKSNTAFNWPAAGGRGFTKSRVENFNKPLNLNIGLVGRHVEDALRFAIVKPAVVDAAKISVNQEFKTAMGELDPVAIDQIIKPALNRADKNTIQNTDPSKNRVMGGIGRFLKSSASAQLMFANVVNTVEQFAGFGISATKISPRYIARSGFKFMSNPKQMSADIAELSPAMRTRSDEQMFEIQKQARDIFSEKNNYTKMKDWLTKHTYFLQAFTQNIVDSITWQASYDESVASGLTNKEAIRKADSDVRTTQSSRRSFDVSNLETNETLQFFQMFMNFFNMLANVNHANFSKLYYEDIGMKKKFAKGLYLYMAGFAGVAIFSGALRKMAAGGLDADDDDEYLDDLYDVLIGSQIDLGLAMMPVAGPAINAGINRYNDKWYDDRVSASPAMSALTTVVGAPAGLFDKDGDLRKQGVRDGFTALGILTGMPLRPISKPITYLMDVSSGDADPTGPIDFTRGLVTGKPGVE